VHLSNVLMWRAKGDDSVSKDFCKTSFYVIGDRTKTVDSSYIRIKDEFINSFCYILKNSKTFQQLFSTFDCWRPEYHTFLRPMIPYTTITTVLAAKVSGWGKFFDRSVTFVYHLTFCYCGPHGV
jgi:hypothetical protein